jgi:hypothetical protein
VGALVAVPIAVYASHQFTDVPNTNPFHADIDWLADAGVTKGCSTTQYCPKDNVTREQMAAFMHRLSGNDPGVAPSVNADQLAGYNVAQLAPRASFNNTNNAADGSDLSLSVQINVPARGTLLMSGGVNAWNTTNADQYACLLQVNDVEVFGTLMSVDLDPVANLNEDCTTSGAQVVDAGTHTIDLEVIGVSATTVLAGASVWVLWVPFDGNGNTP